MLLVDETGRVSRQDAGRPVRFATAADREAVETALVDALAVGADRVTPFELAGELTVRWDGATCTFEMPGGLKPGLAALTFENTTGDPAAVRIAGVREPHTWEEVERRALPRSMPRPTSLPDWVIDAGGASDEPGAGGSITGSVSARGRDDVRAGVHDRRPAGPASFGSGSRSSSPLPDDRRPRSGRRQHPDAGVGRGRVAPDLRERLDRATQVDHRLLVSTGRVQEVGEVILDRPLEVSIADLPAQLGGAETVAQAGVDVAGRRLGERQAGQGGDPRRRVPRIGGCHRLA